MPMSAEAYAGLKAIVEWNPFAAQFLFYLLKDTPHLVKYKDDLYGPLSLLLVNDVIKKPIFHNINESIDLGRLPLFSGVTKFIKLPPFPQEMLIACKVFGDEWKQRKFTKKEFADALEQILLELPSNS